MTDDQKALLVPLMHLRGSDPTGLWCIYDEEAALILDEDWSCDRLLLALESDLDGVPVWEAADALQLSTERAANRDWLARWVADRVRLPQPTAGKITTAPCFEWTDFGGVWLLTAYRGTPCMFSRHDVPGVDPFDPHLLPDGSRWADAAALAVIVRHKAGRP